MSSNHTELRVNQNSFLLPDWLVLYGKQYRITTLRHLQRCCANSVVYRKQKAYRYKLPDGWQAQKERLGNRVYWLISKIN